MRAEGWGFDAPVGPDGYRWWYVDGLSDDGAFGCTVIAFIGSVFSPYYARERRIGAHAGAGADPCNHVAINVALYGVRGPGWAMTERRADAVQRDATSLRIGPSAMAWRNGALQVSVDEWTAPVPRRLRGTITVHPVTRSDACFAIDAQDRHHWRPLAPCARIEVAFAQPAWRWSGPGYIDSNDGDAPLERDFAQWEWSRAPLRDGGSVVLYDAARRDGSRLALARRWHRDGRCEPLEMPERQGLPRGLWGMSRTTHGEPGRVPRLVSSLEDAPFYTRSVIATRVLGEDVTAMHESLSLDRFRQRWVQAMLPVRMPRAI